MSRLLLGFLVAAVLSSAAPALGLAEDDVAATGLARDGVAKYTAGKYREAAELFYRAFELSHRPGPLWNAAKALAMAGERTRATELFHLYRSQPNLTDVERAEAAEELRRLERPRAVETSSTASVAAPRPALEESSPPLEPRPAGLGSVVTLLAGLGAVAVGSGLVIDSSFRQSALEAGLAVTSEGLVIGISRDAALAQRDGIVTERVVASGLIGAGAIAASIVLGLWLFDD